MKQISFAKVTDLILAKPVAPSPPTQTTAPAAAQAPISNTVTTPTSATTSPTTTTTSPVYTSTSVTTATVTVNTVIQPADSAYMIFNPADPFD